MPSINHLRFFSRTDKRICFIVVVITFFYMTACTDKKEDVPYVIELKAIPQAITLNDKYFYPKPFTIRAKYSDKTEKNISKRMSWVSENSGLIVINNKGELEKRADCLQKKCVVSLVATDPESGKSLRLTVNIDQKVQKKPLAEKQQNIEKKDLASSESVTEQEVMPDESETRSDTENINTGISNIAFAPLAKTINSTNKPLLSADNNPLENSVVQRLIFEESEVLLTSGESYVPNVFAIDNNGKTMLNHQLAYNCQLTEQNKFSMIVLTGCELIALAPGEVEITLILQDAVSASTIDTGKMRVRVNPVVIQSMSDGFIRSFNVSTNNDQIWFQVLGLEPFAYYRVKLFGSVTPGYRLSVFTRQTTQYKTCINTVPLNEQSSACYFQAQNNEVMFVIENPLHQSAQANIKLERANESLFQDSAALYEDTPVQLRIAQTVSGFVFANEAGANNQHYYVFEKRSSSDKGSNVVLSNFSAPLKMSINWAGGFCNEKMLKKNNNEISCIVPAHVLGQVFIKIDGNNGEFGLLNGPAATEGGSSYSLSVLSAK